MVYVDDNYTNVKNVTSVGVDCCGCGNCANTCSMGAITMKPDNEGFLTPSIRLDDCINCGACLKACPQTKPVETPHVQNAFAAITHDTEILSNASSGGAFGTIAKYILRKENSYICAASFVNGEVKHIITQHYEDIRKCQGSKYVQSNVKDCIPRLKEILKDANNIVLFCGTPCQVNALYSFLHKHPENLYTLDLVCHGVPSPKFLASDLSHYCKDVASLKDIRFRWRNPNKQKSRSGFILSVIKPQSTHLYSSSYDPYFASFMRGETFRESCYNCHYANLNRIGDITIGDFDSAKNYPEFHPSESKSTVIINNEHGVSLWNEINDLFDFITMDLAKEVAANHQLSHPFKRSSVRDVIYKDAYNLSFYKMKAKYALPITIQQKVMSFLQSHIPSFYKLILEKLY